MNIGGIDINRKEWPLIGLSLLLWARYPIWEYITGAFSHVPIISSFSEYSIGILVIILFLLSLNQIVRHIHIGDILFYIVVVAVFFLNILLYPENSNILNHYMFPFLVMVVPYYFVGLCINVERYDNLFYYVSCLSVLFQSLYIFGLGKGNIIGNEADDMINHAYNILPHVCYICWWMLKQKDLKSIIIFCLGFLLQISMANRGSIVCLVVFIILFFLFIKNYKNKIRVYFTITALGIGLYLFFIPLANLLYSLMNSLNLNTRVLDFVFSANFAESAGRDDINDIIIKSLTESPLTMNGIAGERQLGIVYAHNILLEWCYAFGVFIGILLFVFFLWKIFVAYKSCKYNSDVNKGFLILLFICGIGPLFFSFTYLTYPLFFMLIGFSVRCTRKYTELN